jgi:hypothetical protein
MKNEVPTIAIIGLRIIGVVFLLWLFALGAATFIRSIAMLCVIYIFFLVFILLVFKCVIELPDIGNSDESTAFLWSRPDMSTLPMDYLSSLASQQFAARVESFYEVKANQLILPCKMASRLIETYDRQIQSLEKVAARLDEIEELRRPLAEKLDKLHQFNEKNETADHALQQLEQSRSQLLQLQAKIQRSSQNLEAILNAAEIEAQKRALRAEVNRLARAASQSDAAYPPELELSDIGEDWEQQLTSEITHYMQMEQEVERQLA